MLLSPLREISYGTRATMMSMDALQSTFQTVLDFLAQFPIELLVIGALWFLLAVYAFSAGTARLNAIGLGLAIAGLLFSQIATAWPFSNGLAEAASPWASSVVVCAVLALVSYGVVRRMSGETFDATGSIVTSVFAALAVIAILLALWAHLPALSTFHAFPAPFVPYFAPRFFFWWIFGSLVALAALTRTRFW